MRIVLLGAPGVGKGTLARHIMEKQNIPQISTGDILRGAVKDKTDLGKKAEAYMERGELVPDDLILGIIAERLRREDCAQGFILDGFPRTIPQAEGLERILQEIGIALDGAINITLPEEEIIRRITSRRTCSNPDCQEIYNLYYKPTKVEGICDKCGSPTIQREDEQEETIRRRLKIYDEKTAPLIAFYRERNLLKETKGQNKEEIYEEVQRMFPSG